MDYYYNGNVISSEDKDGNPNNDYDLNISAKLLGTQPVTVFHIGSSINDKPARTMVCKICGSDKFYVGIDSYWTGIKCIKCGWEVCIHEG